MADVTDQQQQAVRAFAIWTTHVAKLLDCSYEDAAVFLMKMGQLIPLMQDPIFQGQLTRYCRAIEANPLAFISPTPQGKDVH